MKQAATAVLLLTIAGAPVTTLACIDRCETDAASASATCHHDGSGAGASITTFDDTCAQLLGESPFLKEDPQTLRTAIPATTPYVVFRAQREALLVSAHVVTPAHLHDAISSLVLRL